MTAEPIFSITNRLPGVRPSATIVTVNISPVFRRSSSLSSERNDQQLESRVIVRFS